MKPSKILVFSKIEYRYLCRTQVDNIQGEKKINAMGENGWKVGAAKMKF